MAHISKRRDRPGYVARWVDASGRERSKSFRRKADASRFLTSMESAKLRGDYVDPRLAATKVRDVAEEWLESTKHEPGTRLNIEGRLRNHVLPGFGEVSIGSIRPQDIRLWVKELLDSGLAPATVVATYHTFAKIVRTAVADGYLNRTPFIGIDLPRLGRRHEMCFLEPQEINELAASNRPRYSTLIYTAAYTGMRWGELTALRVSSLNLLRGTVEVYETQTEISGVIRVKPFTKTGGRRTLSLPTFLAQMIGEHIGRFPGSDERVFSSEEGMPLRRNFYRRHFKPAVLKADLNPRLRFHDLRHTCVAMLIADGAHPAEIMQRLGHSTIKTTFDRYGHLFPSLDQRLRDGLESRYRESLLEKKTVVQ